MPKKGSTGTSMVFFETSTKWKKKQRNKAKRFDVYCKRKSGPVKVKKLKPEELEEFRQR